MKCWPDDGTRLKVKSQMLVCVCFSGLLFPPVSIYLPVFMLIASMLLSSQTSFPKNIKLLIVIWIKKVWLYGWIIKKMCTRKSAKPVIFFLFYGESLVVSVKREIKCSFLKEWMNKDIHVSVICNADSFICSCFRLVL